MRTILRVSMLVLLATPSYADILNSGLDQYEVHDPIAVSIRLDKIKSTDGKDSPISVVIAGLDSAKVTWLSRSNAAAQRKRSSGPRMSGISKPSKIRASRRCVSPDIDDI